MSGFMIATFAFLTGVTVAGLASCLMQIATGRSVGFVQPFVCNRRIVRSLLTTLAAGPFMLGNDALAAWRERRAGWATMLVACLVCGLWASATGILVLEVASRLTAPLVV